MSWSARLEPIVAECTVLRRVVLVEETESTQDEARALGPRAGDVVVARRQIAGRGRYGRRWADTGDDGLAVSFVVESASPARLVLVTAVAAARAAQSLVADTIRIGIKWPNDLVADERKLAGILVEQDDRHAVVGIGMNVAQEIWPAELADRAISLRQLGASADRPDLLERLVPEIDRALQESEDALSAEYAERDALRGANVTVRAAGSRVTGRVVETDPRHGLVIDAGDGPVRLAAETTVIEKVWE